MIRIVIVATLVTVLSGCAFTPQAIVIKPQVGTSASQVGSGRDLALNVVDERPRQTLGTRGPSGVGADLTIDGDLTDIVRTALTDGLLRQKFKPTPTGTNAPSELRVEIRNLDYIVITGFWAGTLRVDFGLKAMCTRNSTRPYEKLYRGEFVESIQVVQSPEANNTYVSTAVSQAVTSLLRDEQLMKCLAQI